MPLRYQSSMPAIANSITLFMLVPCRVAHHASNVKVDDRGQDHVMTIQLPYNMTAIPRIPAAAAPAAMIAPVGWLAAPAVLFVDDGEPAEEEPTEEEPVEEELGPVVVAGDGVVDAPFVSMANSLLWISVRSAW